MSGVGPMFSLLIQNKDFFSLPTANEPYFSGQATLRDLIDGLLFLKAQLP